MAAMTLTGFICNISAYRAWRNLERLAGGMS
jgi:hypothetical protein